MKTRYFTLFLLLPIFLACSEDKGGGKNNDQLNIEHHTGKVNKPKAVAQDCTGVEKVDNPDGKCLIGLLYPETGTLADMGKSIKNVVDMVIEEHNATDSSIKFLTGYADTKTNTEGAADGFNNLYCQGFRQMTGLTSSSNIIKILPRVNALDAVIVSHSSTAKGINGKDDNAVRFSPHDGHQAGFLFEKLNLTNLHTAYIMYRDDVWGNGLKRGLIDGSFGLPTLNFLSYEPDQENFDAQVEELANKISENNSASGIGIVLLSFDEVTAILNSMHQYRLKNDSGTDYDMFGTSFKIFGVDGFAQNTELVKDPIAAQMAIDMKLKASVPGVQKNWSGHATFVAKYKEKYGIDDTRFFTAAQYDAINMLVDTSVKKGCDFDAKKWMSEMPKAAGASDKAATGELKFDENGDRKSQNYDLYEVVTKDSGATYEWQKIVETL